MSPEGLVYLTGPLPQKGDFSFKHGNPSGGKAFAAGSISERRSGVDARL